VVCYCFLIIAEQPTVAPVDFRIDAIVEKIKIAPNRLAAVAVGSTHKEVEVVFMLDKATARGQRRGACVELRSGIPLKLYLHAGSW